MASAAQRSLRIVLLHLAPALGDLGYNRTLLEGAMRHAAARRADWVVTGELIVSGYDFAPVIGSDWIAPAPDDTLEHIATLTRELGIVAFVGHADRDPTTGQLHNTLFVLGRDGRIAAAQHKLWPIPQIEAWAAPGHLGEPVNVDGIAVGLLICADVYRPEPAAKLKDAGAELLISAAAWWPGEWGPAGEWEARSDETGLPIIVCNRTGSEADRDLTAAESVVVIRGQRTLTLHADASTGFVIDCALTDGTLTAAELVDTFQTSLQERSP